MSFLAELELPVWDYFDYFIDVLFGMDVVFNFFTPIMKKEPVIFSHKKIALKYLKFWFWVDFLSVFPFGLIFQSLGSGGYSILLRVSKFPKLYRFMKGAKMLRTIKVQKKGKKSFLGKMIGFFTKSDSIAM